MMISRNIALLSQKGEHITYSQLLDFCEAFTENFHKRSLILIRCDICVEVIMAYVAAMRGRHPVIMAEGNTDCHNVFCFEIKEVCRIPRNDRGKIIYEEID